MIPQKDKTKIADQYIEESPNLDEYCNGLAEVWYKVSGLFLMFMILGMFAEVSTTILVWFSGLFVAVVLIGIKCWGKKFLKSIDSKIESRRKE